MRDTRLKSRSARLSLTLAMTLSGSSVLAATDIPPHIQDAARRLIASRTGATLEEVQLVGSATVDYPLQGLTTYQFKGTNAKGDLAGVTLDPNVKELSADALNSTEDTLRVQRNGRASPALLEALARTAEACSIAHPASSSVSGRGTKTPGPTTSSMCRK